MAMAHWLNGAIGQLLYWMIHFWHSFLPFCKSLWAPLSHLDLLCMNLSELVTFWIGMSFRIRSCGQVKETTERGRVARGFTGEGPWSRSMESVGYHDEPRNLMNWWRRLQAILVYFHDIARVIYFLYISYVFPIYFHIFHGKNHGKSHGFWWFSLPISSLWQELVDVKEQLKVKVKVAAAR